MLSSRPDLLISGVTRACFQGLGNFPDVNERLMTLVTKGASKETQSFRSHVGIGSRALVLVGDSLMMVVAGLVLMLRN